MNETSTNPQEENNANQTENQLNAPVDFTSSPDTSHINSTAVAEAAFENPELHSSSGFTDDKEFSEAVSDDSTDNFPEPSEEIIGLPEMTSNASETSEAEPEAPSIESWQNQDEPSAELSETVDPDTQLAEPVAIISNMAEDTNELHTEAVHPELSETAAEATEEFSLLTAGNDDSGSAAAPVSESHSEEITMEADTLPVSIQHIQEAESPVNEIIQLEDSELEAMETVEAEAQPEDYSGLDKEQLVKLAEQLNRDPDPILANRVIQKIRPLFDALFLKERQEALDKFIENGGTAETFEFRHQQLEQRFHQAQKGISEKRRLSQENQIKERARNLEQKLGLLEQLRLLVNDHEHTPGYEKFKSIREEWKKIGPVGQEHAQNLNASYFSLMDRFHSLSEIYHNLRDFDRKKNLDLKLEIVSRVEKLADEPLVSKAMKELMHLQEEFRTIGPVPNDRFEELKARFKSAVDVLYDRRRAFDEERKGQLQEEISLKSALLEKIAGFDSFVGQSAREWQEKTKELMQLQEEWKAIPGRFREKTAEQGKQFWGIFKKYLANKNEFFKNLDKGKKEVIAAKLALVEEVNSLKDGDDWDGITNRMKELQAEWKKIAPVFGKEGQKVYDDFKAGIDHFFNRLRDRRSGEDKVQNENMQAKDAICAEIETMASEGKGDKAAVEGFRERFRNIGHVPSRQMQRINGRFSKALMTLIDASPEIPSQEKERMKIHILSSRSTYSAEGVKQLKNQESYIQKRLQQLRKDAGNLEDNMAMFKMSKNALSMMEDFQKKINLYKMEIRELEAQLKEIRSTEKAEAAG